MRIPGAAYRLQFHAGFPFAAAEAILDFLHAAVFTAAGDVDFDQAFGRLEQAGIDGMKTVDEFFLRHAGVRQEEAKAAFYRLVAGLAQVSVTGGASLSNVRQNAGRASAASGGL